MDSNVLKERETDKNIHVIYFYAMYEETPNCYSEDFCLLDGCQHESLDIRCD